MRSGFFEIDPFTFDKDNDIFIIQFAWDSISYLGNEYWLGLYSASGDPQAASNSTLPYIAHPGINPDMYDLEKRPSLPYRIDVTTGAGNQQE
jgi:hypothetical protein